jgi:hypothetical protein
MDMRLDQRLDTGITKNMKKTMQLFRCTRFSTVDCVAIALLNTTARLNTTTDTFCAFGLLSPPHSLGHDTRLVTTSPVH